MNPRIARRPAYLQIYDAIREQILDGDYEPGDTLPPYAELQEEFGVAQGTAVKAVKTLERDGLVKTRVGAPAEVARQEVHRTGLDRAVSVRKNGKIYNNGEYARIVSAKEVDAPEDVAVILGCNPGDKVVKRVRVTYDANDRPTSYSTSWYRGEHADVAPLLLVPERIVEGSWRYLERMLGLTATHGRDQDWPSLATNEDAERLQLELPAAVKVTSTVLLAEDGTVIEHGVSVSGSNRRATYEYELAPQQ